MTAQFWFGFVVAYALGPITIGALIAWDTWMRHQRERREVREFRHVLDQPDWLARLWDGQ